MCKTRFFPQAKVTSQEQELASLTEDSARAENARMDAERLLNDESGDAELQAMFNECKREQPEAYAKVEGFAFLGVSRATLFSALVDFCSSLTAATERAEKAERALAVHDDMAEARVRRLTAEVEEWKKKAEKLENDVAFADGFATAAGQRNVRLTAELSRLRRESVRVDVLLRWMFFSGTVELARYELVYPEQDSDCPLSPLPPSQPPTQEEQR